MERLTINEVIEHCKRQTHEMEKYNSKELLETGDIGFTGMKRYWEHRQVEKWLEELKAYRTAEEQGLLLRLPCKVGDTVYIIQNEPTSVSTDGYNSNGWKEVISERKIEKYEDYFHLTEVIHHKVYSTYQEAELELANRQQSHAEAIMNERNGR